LRKRGLVVLGAHTCVRDLIIDDPNWDRLGFYSGFLVLPMRSTFCEFLVLYVQTV
jgi:hypothetical protein